MNVVTLDTGALIAMERRKQRAAALLRAAREQRAHLYVITPVVTEWWRGRTDVRVDLKRALRVVPFPVHVAEIAGLVLGRIERASERTRLILDVMVMAFAATEGGGVVYTSDVADLSRLKTWFPSVRVLGM
jgi:predicted nucleic acid-binding protein